MSVFTSIFFPFFCLLLSTDVAVFDANKPPLKEEAASPSPSPLARAEGGRKQLREKGRKGAQVGEKKGSFLTCLQPAKE